MEYLQCAELGRGSVLHHPHTMLFLERAAAGIAVAEWLTANGRARLLRDMYVEDGLLLLYSVLFLYRDVMRMLFPDALITLPRVNSVFPIFCQCYSSEGH